MTHDYRVHSDPEVNRRYTENERLEHLEMDSVTRRMELNPILDYVNLKMENEQATKEMLGRIKERIISGTAWGLMLGGAALVWYAFTQFIKGGP